MHADPRQTTSKISRVYTSSDSSGICATVTRHDAHFRSVVREEGPDHHPVETSEVVLYLVQFVAETARLTATGGAL